MLTQADLLSELYSSDDSHILYNQEQYNTISVVNGTLFLIYYLFLFIYIYYLFRRFHNISRNPIIILLLCFLFAYPFIIYKLEYYVYSIGKYLFEKIYYYKLY